MYDKNTYQLAAGVALHSLSLAVTGEVVRATALVAGSSTGVSVSSTETAVESAAGSSRGPGSTGSRSGAVALGEGQRFCPENKKLGSTRKRTARWPGWLQL